MRADWLVGSLSLADDEADWPMTADEAVAFLRDGLAAWRDGLVRRVALTTRSAKRTLRA